jgi:2-polyprenyl-3-methyl-5-hydroxy-6-metoxy-1,4-benzoquinol methylase
MPHEGPPTPSARELHSPPSAYYDRRYREGSDRWTRDPEEEVTDLLIRQLEPRCTIRPLRVLDAGCGHLRTALALSNRLPGLRITAIDYAYDAIITVDAALPSRAANAGIDFRKADFFAFEAHAPYDVLLDLGLLHHLVPEDWHRYVERVDRLLSANGGLLLHCFHPRDGNWQEQCPGGHERKGYYCHYHTLHSLASLLGPILPYGRQLALHTHNEHVIGWYRIRATEVCECAPAEAA